MPENRTSLRPLRAVLVLHRQAFAMWPPRSPFDAGVERVVIGTAALADPDFVRDLAADHRVAVGLDAKAGEVATDGWLVGSGRSVLDVARSFADAGVDALVVTDISHGTLEGPDLVGLREVEATPVDVIGPVVLPCRPTCARRNRCRRASSCRCDTEGDVRRPLHRRRGCGSAGDRVVSLCHPGDPVSDVDGGRVVKGVNFVDIRDVGDPVELAARYDEQGADELVFLDITASSGERDTTVEMVQRLRSRSSFRSRSVEVSARSTMPVAC